MAIETDNDWLEMLDVDEFAEEVVLDPDSSATTIAAIFESGWLEIEGVGILDTSTAETLLICKSSDVASVVADVTIVVVQSVRYKVGDIQPDGTGSTTLRIYEEDV